MKPILKIKRGNGIPSGLTAAELAIDLQSNKLYVGNILGNSVPIAAQVDVAIGTSDNKIITQSTVKSVVDSSAPSGGGSSYIDKKVLLLTVPAATTNSAVQKDFIPLYSATPQFNTFTGDLFTSTGELQIDDPAGTGSGITQISKTAMYLNVDYSMIYSANPTTAVDASGQYWRLSGMRVIDVNNISDVTYYGIKVTPPMIGNSIQTFMNANAIVKLPKNTYNPTTGLGKRYVLQFIFQIFSSYLLHQIGNPALNSAVGVMTPIASDYGIRIEISKIGEDI